MKNNKFITAEGHTLNIGDKFRLIGVTEIFTVVSLWLAAGFIPSVKGMNERHQTFARTLDVRKLPQVAE